MLKFKKMENNKEMKNQIFAITILLSVAITACGTPSAAPSPEEITNHVWVLQSYAGQAVLEDTHVTLEFDTETQTAGGNASCNSYSSEYQLDGSSIAFPMAMSTMMACSPQEIMDQETAFLSLLGQSESLEIRDGQLLLFTAEGDELIFTAK